MPWIYYPRQGAIDFGEKCLPITVFYNKDTVEIRQYATIIVTEIGTENILKILNKRADELLGKE